MTKITCTGCGRKFKDSKGLLVHRHSCQKYQDIFHSLAAASASIVRKRPTEAQIGNTVSKRPRQEAELRNTPVREN